MLELLSSEWNFFYFTLTIVIVAGKLRDIYVKSIPGRNERLRKEQEHQHTLQLLKMKQDHELVLAAKIHDPVQILALDPVFGESFDRRLRIALAKQGVEYPLEVTDEEVDELEMEKYVKSHARTG